MLNVHIVKHQSVLRIVNGLVIHHRELFEMMSIGQGQRSSLKAEITLKLLPRLLDIDTPTTGRYLNNLGIIRKTALAGIVYPAEPKAPFFFSRLECERTSPYGLGGSCGIL